MDGITLDLPGLAFKRLNKEEARSAWSGYPVLAGIFIPAEQVGHV